MPMHRGSESLLAINTQLLQQTQELEDALAAARLMTAALAATSDVVIVADLGGEGLIRFVNAAWERLTGFRPGEAVNVRPPVVLEAIGADPVLREQYARSIATAAPLRFETDIRGADGRMTAIEVTLSPIRDEDGSGKNWVIVERDLTERRSAAAALAAAEGRLPAIIERSHELISIVDAGGAIIFESPNQERLLGYPPGAALGKSIFSFIHADDVARVRALFGERVNIAGIAAPVELRYRTADGGYAELEAVGNNLLDDPRVRGIVITARDVSERKRADAAFRAQEARFRAIVEQSFEAVLIVGPRQPIVTFATPSMRPLLGYEPEEVVGGRLGDLTHPDDVARIGKAFAAVSAGPRGTSRKEAWRMRHKNGSWRWCEGVGTNLVGLPGVDGIVINFHDITDRKKAEEEFKMLEALRAKMAQIMTGPMLSSLTAMRWNMDQMMGAALGTLGEEQREFGRIVQEATLAMLHDIQSLSFAMDVERGQIVLHRGAVSLESVWRSVEAAAKRRCAMAGITCTTAARRAPLPAIDADAERLRIVFDELLRNAIEFTPRDGTVRARFRTSRETVRFEIVDTGIGIPAEEQPRLFEHFYRASNAASMRAEALGLGLANAKAIVENHGGTIGFTSVPGKGSTFWFELPIRAEA